ncbi:chromosomal replication initiator protein DnaA [Candidatus Leptofilum sp.]|uniref:chromosomal replication initiator protein DnaA n=1 Tax=Candidatus Leptofilum sp. TaxID=3241576 RepID=UPI003B5A5EF4
MIPENAWKATLGELELQMTKATFNTWLKDTCLLRYSDNLYVVGVRNAYAKDWLENRLRDTILRTLSAIVDAPVEIQFMVWTDEVPLETVIEEAAEYPQPQPALNGTSMGETAVKTQKSPPSTNGNSLTRRFTFGNFVVGSSNRLAHAAALSVAEHPGQTYNPLFIYGGVGLGKTHLLHAIGHKCQQEGLSVCYIPSETFTNDLVQSIRNKQMEQFRERYRTPDVLLIDDIQFIAGKESTQEELFHTFNELHSQGKQVVISSDRAPKAMATLEERLQSRFEWGLMADIQMPDIETRKAILQTKAEANGLVVPDELMDFIAQQVRHSIRELEGAFNKVMAYAHLSGGRVNMELVNMALADLMHRPEKLTVEHVFEAVCKYYNVTNDDLIGASRKKTIAYPRQMAMYLARTETNASLPQIGEKLGNRDHTTVLYGYEKIATLIDADSQIRRDCMEIKSSMYGAPVA